MHQIQKETINTKNQIIKEVSLTNRELVNKITEQKTTKQSIAQTERSLPHTNVLSYSERKPPNQFFRVEAKSPLVKEYSAYDNYKSDKGLKYIESLEQQIDSLFKEYSDLLIMAEDDKIGESSKKVIDKKINGISEELKKKQLELCELKQSS